MAKTGFESAPLTGDDEIDGILSGVRWKGNLITYGIPVNAFEYGFFYTSTYKGDFDDDSSTPDTKKKGNETIGFQQLDAHQSDVVDRAFADIREFTTLHILKAEPAQNADIRLAMSSEVPNLHVDALAYGNFPGAGKKAGDAWFDTTSNNYAQIGAQAFRTIYHEIGHTMGLKHPFDDGSGDNSLLLPNNLDGMEYTVMSYDGRGGEGSALDMEEGNLPQGYMLGDIVALQAMYGANFTTRQNDTVYRFDAATGRVQVDGGFYLGQSMDGYLDGGSKDENGNSVNILFRTIWDGNGTDTYDFSGYTTNLRINLNPGGSTDVDATGNFQAANLGESDDGEERWAVGQVYNAFLYNGDRRSMIENARGGTGDDKMTGNGIANLLEGGEGKDTLNGGADMDTLIGGAGDDVYLLYDVTDGVYDRVRDQFEGDHDLVKVKDWNGNSVRSYTMTGTTERGMITGTDTKGFSLHGNSSGNELTDDTAVKSVSGAAGNSLFGEGGNDTLDGGLGMDTLVGGAKDDTYYLFDLTKGVYDRIVEDKGGGTDTAYVVDTNSANSYTLAANVEIGQMRKDPDTNRFSSGFSLHGNLEDNLLIDIGGNNSLYGEAGKDTLDGGLGRDTLVGGMNNDVYHLFDLNVGGYDKVVEDRFGGTDTVLVRDVGAAVRSYTLTDQVENGAIVGAEADQFTLIGNELNNKLFDDIGDNILVGGAGNDTLDGGDFYGGDVLQGGKDDDTYILSIRNGNYNYVEELADEGIDTVIVTPFHEEDEHYTDVYALTANVENGTLAGSGSFGLYGNDLDNVLKGNLGTNTIYGFGGDDTIRGGESGGDILDGGAGNDTVNGGRSANILYGGADDDTLNGAQGNDTLYGGLGNDTLTGGQHKDLFVFAEAAGDANADKITDFSVADDTIGLDASIFTALASDGSGKLVASTFFAGTAAHDSDDRVIFDSATGRIWYDADGDGDGAKKLIATVTPNLALTAADFLVIGAPTGGLGNDTIVGGDNADTLDGGPGADVLRGGKGDDIYHLYDVTNGAYDIVVEEANGGNDLVMVKDLHGAPRQYTLTDNVERGAIVGADAMSFVLIGNGLDNQLSDDAGSNVLWGEGGNDTLDGGAGDDTLAGGIGDDLLTGGSGNDTYHLEDLTGGDGIVLAHYDAVVENADGGIDTILVLAIDNIDTFSDGYVLPDNVEIGTITGTLAFNLDGNASDNLLSGNDADNTLSGLDGADTLAGGLGDDVLIGGTGNDTYHLEDLTGGDGIVLTHYDAVVEEADGGTDTVFVFAMDNLETFADGYTLADNVENGIITGSLAFALDGNTLDNVLTGNDGDNVLSGFEGKDTLDGDKGNDTLNGGIGDDLLTGGAGNDTLDGGADLDVLRGGADDDLYHLFDVTNGAYDTVVEDENGGKDFVLIRDLHSGVTQYTLADNVEGAGLVGADAEGFTLFGNKLDNELWGDIGGNTFYGEDGNDMLDGGAGNDTLYGGSGDDSIHGGGGNDLVIGMGGKDTFVFDVAYDAGNADTIEDFNTTDDTIALDNDIFTAAGPLGTLSSSAFYWGTAAHSTSDRVIFDAATGRLWYDADGTGGTEKYLFATIEGSSTSLPLSAANFTIVD